MLNGSNILTKERTDVDIHESIDELADGFASCTRLLTALGDETRQHIILKMMKIMRRGGLRVGEITEKTNLSRPAVSHHLQILKEAGIIKMRKEGTKNFYYFDTTASAFAPLVSTVRLTHEILERWRTGDIIDDENQSKQQSNEPLTTSLGN